MAKVGRYRSDRAGVITECSIVIPLLAIFFGGIVQAGLYVSQVALAGQTAYQAALLGGKTNKTDRLGAMIARANELNAVLVKKLDDVNFVTDYSAADRVVTFEYRSKVKSIIPGYNIPLVLKFTGPVLVNDVDSVGDLGNFDNGTCYFNNDYVKFCDAQSRPPESVPEVPQSDFRKSAPVFERDTSTVTEFNYITTRTGRTGRGSGTGSTGTGTGSTGTGGTTTGGGRGTTSTTTAD